MAMDDARIRELARGGAGGAARSGGLSPARSDLEARVATLESEVARLRQARALPVVNETPAVHVHVAATAAPEHPSLGRLGPGAGSDRCVLEPDKPCVQSGQCRTFGH